MRKLLNKPWFVALLAIAAIAAVWTSVAPATRPARIAASAEPLATTEPAAEENTALPSHEAMQPLPVTKASRDPFAVSQVAQPTQSVEVKPEEPDLVDTVRLSCLWTQNGATLMLINDRIHNTGDTIGHLTIESASPQGVWLAHTKGRAFLEIGKTFVLKTPPARR